MRNLPPRRARWIRARIFLLALLLLGGAGAVTYRAFDLQVKRADSLRAMAQDQYLRDIRLAPKRGTIYDRHGAELAVSVDVDSIWANPRRLRRNGVNPAMAAHRLSALLGVDRGVITRRLSSKRYFVWIKRRVSPRQSKAVKALGISGVRITKEARRFYPNRQLAAHVLGFADVDGKGIEGLELRLEDSLRGSTDTVPAIRDRRGVVVFSEQLLDDRAAQGDDITLSIDKTIQHIAERELELAIRTFEARAGSVVVIDPRSGEILAMANYPSYNPNEPGKAPPSHRRNRAITDRFEPGSTVKPFTVAGALASGAIRNNQLIDCLQGEMQVAEYTIHDTKKWGELTPAQILAHSSNIGAAKIGMSMGRASLFRTFRRFGFGQRTDLELPGEAAGILRHYRKWYEMDVATISFGQGMSSTALQLTMAMGALANQGRLMKPILVKSIVDARGNVVEQSVPRVRRRVVPSSVARLVSDMLTGVTDTGGTGTEAAVEGYLVAGKTGTAQKADYIKGGYAKGKWNSSFVGFAPAERPRLVVTVIIDEPIIAHYGGTVAGPVFRRVMRASLRHLGVMPHGGAGTLDAHVRRSRLRQKAREAAEEIAEQKLAPRVDLPPLDEGRARVPDLLGKSARAALVAARDADLVVTLEGSGLVVSQQPAADEIADRGDTVHIELAPPDHDSDRRATEAAAADPEAERARAQPVVAQTARRDG